MSEAPLYRLEAAVDVDMGVFSSMLQESLDASGGSVNLQLLHDAAPLDDETKYQVDLTQSAFKVVLQKSTLLQIR